MSVSSFKPPNVAYVVFVGRTVGIFENWAGCKTSTDHFAGARFRGYPTYEKAVEQWEAFEDSGVIPPWPPKFYVAPPMLDEKMSKKKMLALIQQRAKMLVTSHTGSHTTTCTAATCTYPACLCQ